MPQRRGLAGAAVPGLVCGRFLGLVCRLAVKGLCEGQESGGMSAARVGGAAVPGLVCGRFLGLVCRLTVKELCEGPGKRRHVCGESGGAAVPGGVRQAFRAGLSVDGERTLRRAGKAAGGMSAARVGGAAVPGGVRQAFRAGLSVDGERILRRAGKAAGGMSAARVGGMVISPGSEELREDAEEKGLGHFPIDVPDGCGYGGDGCGQLPL